MKNKILKLFFMGFMALICVIGNVWAEESSAYGAAEELHITEMQNDKEYAEFQLRRVQSGKQQGVYENVFVVIASIFMIAIVSISAWRHCSLKITVHTLLILFPLYFCILILLVINSFGEWGALKHPWLSQYVGETTLDYSVYIPYVFPAFYLLVYAYLLITHVIKRRYIIVSMIVFYAVVSALSVVGYFIAQLG